MLVYFVDFWSLRALTSYIILAEEIVGADSNYESGKPPSSYAKMAQDS